MADTPMTVVETDEFLQKAKPLMSDAEREDLVAFLGANPKPARSSRQPGV
jgi:dsDNA-binding SOS-regulon protein